MRRMGSEAAGSARATTLKSIVTIRITSTYFCAGVTPCNYSMTAPILKWMVRRQFSREEIEAYCEKKGWQHEVI